MADNVKVVKKNSKGDEVTVYVKSPNSKDRRDSEIVYNRALRKALEDGVLLRAKMDEFVKQQGLWSEAKEKEYKDVIEQIQALEPVLKKGNISLSKARDTALELQKLRAKFRELIGERQRYGNNCAENIADNATFDFLVSRCVVDANGNTVWSTEADYERDANEPWAVEAAAQLARLLYGLDPEYEKNLVENQFLIKYKFVNKDLQLINKDGHLIDEKGRLVNEEGYYVAYRESGEQYFVDIDGNEVDKDGNRVFEFLPFTDDEGNPVAPE